MALFVLVSTIGIAQVTHFCNMAISSIEKVSCEQKHKCCDSADDSCCVPVYKYYHSDIATVISKPMAPVTPAFSDLFFIPVSPALAIAIQTHSFQSVPEPLVVPSGPDIRISSGSLLI